MGLVLFCPVYYYSTKSPGTVGEREPSVADGVSRTLRDSELTIWRVEPEDALAGSGIRTVGTLRVVSPVFDAGKGDQAEEFYHEIRLLSVTENGFEVRFLRSRADNNILSSNVLFRFGEITKTNVLGWGITGQFAPIRK